MLIKIILTLILLFPSISYSATKLIDEDFESTSATCFTVPTEGTSYALSPSGVDANVHQWSRAFHAECVNSCDNCDHDDYPGSFGGDIPEILQSDPGCQDNGNCARIYIDGSTIDGSSYSEPKFHSNDGIGGGTSVYVKFDIKIDPNLGTSNGNREIYNFKIIRITDDDSARTGTLPPYYATNINFEPSDASYSWYGMCSSEYYFARATTRTANSLMDNDWHTLEFYIELGSYSGGVNDSGQNSIVRIWEDGVLILEDEEVPRCDGTQAINSLAVNRHAKALGAPTTPMQGNIYYDNIEVWDGMPDSENARISGIDIQ